MWSGLIGEASAKLMDAGVITAAQLQDNMATLKAIAAYCVRHGIAVAVGDNLT